MQEARILAGDNGTVLRQGVDLLRLLDDPLYGGDGSWEGVGKQFRHLIDFYECFLEGHEESRVDYVRRRRDPRLEQNRELAIRRIESLIDRLTEFSSDEREPELWIKAEPRLGDDGDPIWSRSSVSRELQFLLSHTVHHYALVKYLLELRGVETPVEFGIAPSTLQHWQKAEQGVRSLSR